MTPRQRLVVACLAAVGVGAQVLAGSLSGVASWSATAVAVLVAAALVLTQPVDGG